MAHLLRQLRRSRRSRMLIRSLRFLLASLDLHPLYGKKGLFFSVRCPIPRQRTLSFGILPKEPAPLETHNILAFFVGWTGTDYWRFGAIWGPVSHIASPITCRVVGILFLITLLYGRGWSLIRYLFFMSGELLSTRAQLPARASLSQALSTAWQ